MEGQNQKTNIIIAYFSWGGNTRKAAQEIHNKTGGELFEIECIKSYSRNYNTATEEAKKDQKIKARPALKTHIANMEQFDIVFLGYPNWWSSIPMPVAAFLEEYDFSGKTIIPFCSHGGGRFGQSLSEITKLVPHANTGEALSIYNSGGASLLKDITDWLRKNGIREL